jgi:hypothetical protein
MTVEQLITKLRQLPNDTEVGYPAHADYHGDTYFEPIAAGNPGIDGLLSFVDGTGFGALHAVRP